ncbi:hypothetical protein [Haloferax sp. YSMS24]|uniref:hypothetical protein n=1 Tax=unclassified Haloferax TaxID=2625095 RepID=UPI00398D2841
MDPTSAWDATLRIVFGLFILGIGNLVGGFLATTAGFAGIVLYAFIVLITAVFGVYYVVIGVGMVVEAATMSAIERSALPTSGLD